MREPRCVRRLRLKRVRTGMTDRQEERPPAAAPRLNSCKARGSAAGEASSTIAGALSNWRACNLPYASPNIKVPRSIIGAIHMIILRAEGVMADTIALVTGANKGIGREISRQLSAKGVLVLMAARDRERGASAAATLRAQGLVVEFTEMDVTSQPSVDHAAAEVERRYGRLDILVNNAGVALDWIPGSELSIEALRQTFEVNVFGAFRVTKALLPLLRKSKHGRIVNISSGLGSLGRSADTRSSNTVQNMLLAYCSSKAALNMITIQLANELKDVGIKVNSANPGYTATDLNQHRGVKTVEQGAATPIRLALLPDDGPTGGVFSDDGPEPW
jgi:NAD(P)-dependent dehydrogenase (short-subunit alcohol dehydrogenase family)